MNQAEGFLVVIVCGCDPLTVWPCTTSIFDQLALAFGVVVDVGDEGRSCRHATQVHVHFIEQVGFVKRGTIDAAIRRDGGEWAVECIVSGTASEAAVVGGGV